MIDKTAEFMLEEYKQIANGYQDLHAQQNELIKFYLTLVAIPASVLAVAAQFLDKLPAEASSTINVQMTPPLVDATATIALTPVVQDTPAVSVIPTSLQTVANAVVEQQTTDTIATIAMPILLVLLVALVLIGYAVYRALIHTRWEALYYVKTVNAVRRYFVEHDPEGTLNKYLVLPDVDSRPTYWEGQFSRAFWNVFMVASLNSAVVFATLYAGLQWLGIASWAFSAAATASLMALAFQLVCHPWILKRQDRKYQSKFQYSYPIRGRDIGIDLDGVLDDLMQAVLNKASSMFNISIQPDQITSHRLQDCTSLDPEQIQTIFSSTDIFKTVNPIQGALEALLQLKNNNWAIYIITDRFWSDQDWVIAKAWLEQHGFPWDHMNVVRAVDKAAYAQSHHIGVFVEDNLDTVLRLSSVCTQVFLLDWPYNQGTLPANVKRCASWQEILHELTPPKPVNV